MTNDTFDYIIIGSGIAGLYTALLAMQYGTVLILTKGSVEDCNTQYAQGGIAAAIGPNDSPESHFADTLAAGAGLCNEVAADILAKKGPRAIAELVRLGVIFDTANGEISLGREAAHGLPRVLHAGGDATGAHIELTLANLARSSNIKVLEFATTINLLKNPAHDRVVGVTALDIRDGIESSFYATNIVLATGGAGQMYRYTTNPLVTTGDGISLAYNAGAAVVDMEFYQFHPTALCILGAPPFLISEAMRGEGAILRNTDGNPFMSRYHPQGDLAPRDVVSRSLLEEMRSTDSNHVLLDATHLPSELLKTRFPSIYNTCLTHGLDITKDAIPVSPAAHYMMGGVLTNTDGETTIPGLYACGEVAGTGLHGANRLASNSLLETVVFGERLVQRTIKSGWSGPKVEEFVAIDKGNVDALEFELPTKQTIQDVMWSHVGILRNKQGLDSAATTLDSWSEKIRNNDRGEIIPHELANMVLLGRLITKSALTREESRGAHYRTDYPAASSDWVRHIVISKSRT